MNYFELNISTNFTFLKGASHPSELVIEAARLGYDGIAITDECSLAGIVRAHVEAKKQSLQLLIGSRIKFEGVSNDPLELILICPCRISYAELSTLITIARRRAKKGSYVAQLEDLERLISLCLAIWLPPVDQQQAIKQLNQIVKLFPERLWIGYSRLLRANDHQRYQECLQLARLFNLPMVAQNQVLMHVKKRLKLQHCLTAISHNQTVQTLGNRLISNAEQHLRSLDQLASLYPKALLDETLTIASRCHFSLDELRYEYPDEVLPKNRSPTTYLRELVFQGARRRYPKGIKQTVKIQIEHELNLIKKLSYEHYFLTVFDIVHFAKSHHILCQGRGSAANSAVCFCLNITEVDPECSNLLFERFISLERKEPPDIDVDFEHHRREEVIQYIYKKYSRERAALAATVITYRMKSAIRDVGKALGIDLTIVEYLSGSLAWWDKPESLQSYFKKANLSLDGLLANDYYELVLTILGFPRHLSQHVGGFIITKGAMSSLVPVENASMPDRTVIQWDKYDIEALKLMKIDILGLGMLTMLRKCLQMISKYSDLQYLSDIPKDDPATYEMLCNADTVGVFQIESRAQMSMLPRLRPRCFYDLVIQIAIVRPGPIQGKMVHPYLKRRNGTEAATYPNDEIKKVLERTLGVPIFQEQVIKLAMVAAGFSGGQADQLRRAMASWGRDGELLQFEENLIGGMQERGYSKEFANRLFEQLKGFGSYGFPESHSASFALLAYFSAWLKRHHGAAFYCALLNSLPMGFYSASQLVQDARRHHINVLPVNIDESLWQSTIGSELPQPLTIQLGLHLVKGFSEQAAQRLIEARTNQAFTNIKDLVYRANLRANEKDALVKANTMPRLASNRHQAQWQSLAIEESKELLVELDALEAPSSNAQEAIRAPTVIEDMVADYHSTGLTLNQHPIAIMREKRLIESCKQAINLGDLRHGQFVKVAGVVTCRQRPGTAAGVLFITLEDETGNMNIIVWKNTLEKFRKPILGSRILFVKGKIERERSVVHIVAGHILDISDRLQDFGRGSRDFH